MHVVLASHEDAIANLDGGVATAKRHGLDGAERERHSAVLQSASNSSLAAVRRQRRCLSPRQYPNAVQVTHHRRRPTHHRVAPAQPAISTVNRNLHL